MSDVPTPDPSAATGDTVDVVLRTVEARLAELQPYLDEAERLRSILAAAEGTEASAPSAPEARPARRRQGSNKRTILAVIAQRPGVTSAEIARIADLKRTVVASTVSRLKRNGELEPEGDGVRLPHGTTAD